MKGSVSSLKQQLLEDLLGERLEEYKNFSREKPTTKKRNHRQLIPLWKFMLQLLHRDAGSKYVEWTEDEPLQFRIKEPSFVADLWGSMKYKSGMNYEKLSRAMRYYYGKNIIEKVGNKRYCYQFIMSKKTEKYISQFMDVDGPTLKRKKRKLTSSARSDGLTDDDSVSISSTGSYSSDDTSRFRYNSLHAAQEAVVNKDREEFDEENKKVGEKERGDENESLSNITARLQSKIPLLSIPTVKKAPIINHKIRGSTLDLAKKTSTLPSAFTRTRKGNLIANKTTGALPYDFGKICCPKRPILPYELYKQQLLKGFDTTIYTLKNSKITSKVPVDKSDAEAVKNTRQTCDATRKKCMVSMLSYETDPQFNISGVQDRTKKKARVHDDQKVTMDLKKYFPVTHLEGEINLEMKSNLIDESAIRRQEASGRVAENNSMVRRKDPFMGFADARTDFSLSQPYLSEIFSDV